MCNCSICLIPWDFLLIFYYFDLLLEFYYVSYGNYYKRTCWICLIFWVAGSLSKSKSIQLLHSVFVGCIETVFCLLFLKIVDVSYITSRYDSTLKACTD